MKPTLLAILISTVLYTLVYTASHLKYNIAMKGRIVSLSMETNVERDWLVQTRPQGNQFPFEVGSAAAFYTPGTLDPLFDAHKGFVLSLDGNLTAIVQKFGVFWSGPFLTPAFRGSRVTNVKLNGVETLVKCGGADHHIDCLDTQQECRTASCYKITTRPYTDTSTIPARYQHDWPAMKIERYGHTLTGFHDGKIIATGGGRGEKMKSAEMYQNGAWNRIADMSKSRVWHSAVALDSDTLLVCGGVTSEPNCEIYNKTSNTWSMYVEYMKLAGQPSWEITTRNQFLGIDYETRDVCKSPGDKSHSHWQIYYIGHKDVENRNLLNGTTCIEENVFEEPLEDNFAVWPTSGGSFSYLL